MSTFNGVLGKLGVGVESPYGSAATATEMLRLLSEGLSPEIARVTSPILDGTAAQREDRRGNKSVNGSCEIELDYDNIEKILTACFGNHAGGVYTLVDTEHDSLTVWLEKTVSRFRGIGGKVDSFVLAGDQQLGVDDLLHG